MKKSLFDENDRYTVEALELSSFVNSALRNKIEELANQGYSIRDMNCILVESVQELVLEELLMRPVEKKL